MGKTVYVVFRSTLVEFFIEEQSAERASMDISRWSGRLQVFDYDIKYKPGAANIVPTQYPNYQTWMNGRDAEKTEKSGSDFVAEEDSEVKDHILSDEESTEEEIKSKDRQFVQPGAFVASSSIE
ncbi:hypothetical protein T01_14101 [Trichinella spiralis]|uniref:Uncharacterized protein n=1 Tax=Trichinella spiralis TaxID=6334 RepID=A0A0V1C0P7_TRISP|nr:hypothetical protein T01_14101 [Trichinella spiralis]